MILNNKRMTISQWLNLPEWEKDALFEFEMDRVERITTVMDSLVEQELYTAEAHANLNIALWG